LVNLPSRTDWLIFLTVLLYRVRVLIPDETYLKRIRLVVCPCQGSGWWEGPRKEGPGQGYFHN